MAPLNPIARGLLEQLIDRVIGEIPFHLGIYRNVEAKKSYQYMNSDDFVLGLTIGKIRYTFETLFEMANGRKYNADETIEISKVIYSRMPQIRSAFMDAG